MAPSSSEFDTLTHGLLVMVPVEFKWTIWVRATLLGQNSKNCTFAFVHYLPHGAHLGKVTFKSNALQYCVTLLKIKVLHDAIA